MVPGGLGGGLVNTEERLSEPSYLPRTVCSPGTWGTWSPPPSFGPLEAGGSWTQGLGTISFQRKGFRAKPRLRDKRPSVHPWVPSPSFPEQHSFMPAPPPRPASCAPALRTLLPFTASRPACLFVVQAFCCSLFSPPQAPSKQTLPGHHRVWGPGGGLRAKAESRPGAWGPPGECCQRRQSWCMKNIRGTALGAVSGLAVPAVV